MAWFMSKGLTKYYGNVTALNDLNLEINSNNKIVGLIGPNGSGKSTLLKIAYGLVKPSKGDLRILSFDSWREQTKLRRKISYVSENPLIVSDVYVKDIISLFGSEQNDVFKELEINAFSDKKVKILSAGQKQLLKLAIAFSQKHDVILMDEPFKDLDQDKIQKVIKLIHEYSDKYGIKFIISSHILKILEEVIDYLVVIQNGELVLQGSPKEISHHQFVIESSNNDIVLSILKKLDMKCWIENEKIIVYFENDLEELARLLLDNNVLKYVTSISKPQLSTLYKSFKRLAT